MERRVTERFEMNVRLTCRVPARPCPATLVDLSYEGCRVEIPYTIIELGGTALIDLPSAAGFSGRVMWVNGASAGIRFHRRLGKLTAIALGIAPPEPEAPPEPSPEPTHVGGFLRHWVRRLVGFS